MSHRYREELRRRAAHDDAAFIEYMPTSSFPTTCARLARS